MTYTFIVILVLLLTFCFLLAKEAFGHFSEEFLGRAWRVELWHHHTAAGRELIRSEALEGAAKDVRQEPATILKRHKSKVWGLL